MLSHFPASFRRTEDDPFSFLKSGSKTSTLGREEVDTTYKPDEKQRKAVDSRFGRLAESETENTCGDYLRQPTSVTLNKGSSCLRPAQVLLASIELQYSLLKARN